MISFLSSIIGPFKRIVDFFKREKTTPSNELNIRDSNNNTINNQQSITNNNNYNNYYADKKTPESLAKPNIKINQVGFRGVEGQDPVFTFSLKNHGGALLRTSVRFAPQLEHTQIPKDNDLGTLTRHSETIATSLPRGTELLNAIVIGYDQNGKKLKVILYGSRNEQRDFIFPEQEILTIPSDKE